MPKASGEYASKPHCSRMAISARPTSKLRLSRLYGFWIDTARLQPRLSASCRNFMVPHGVSLDRPI
ncbi:hypothetical protein D3C79_917060 [compost metagenome]